MYLCLFIVFRFFDESTGHVESKFWELTNVFDIKNDKQPAATAEHLFNCIIETLNRSNVPLDNLIGFASDGCNVMMGSTNSVASRFRLMFPGIFILKCICHSAHLCASEACKQLPRSCEDMARAIFNFLHSSAKRQSTLKQFQKFLDLKPHSILHPSQTRWLSLEPVINRILDQWEALRLYFTDSYLDQKLLSTEHIYISLNDKFMKLYYYFLAWILPKFNEFNRYFQSQKVVISDLHDKIRCLYQEILLSFLKRNYVMTNDLNKLRPDNGENHLPDSQLYSGAQVLKHINAPELSNKIEQKKQFFMKCRQFLQTAALELKKRYDMEDPVLSNLSSLSAKNALSIEYHDSHTSLVPLISLMPRIVPKENSGLIQKIDDQWRGLILKIKFMPTEITNLQYANEPPDVFW